MDVMLFSKRLRRLVGGEETGTLLDEINEQIQNLHKEIEFMASFARAYEYEVNYITQHSGEEDGEEEEEHQFSLFHGEEGHQIQKIMRKIMYFVLKSERAIDTFVIDILQNKNESCRSKELCDYLQDQEQAIIDIRVEMEQLLPNQRSNSSSHEYSCSSSIALERKEIREFIIKKKTRMVGREDEMEKVLDLLIEGQPSLSAVSIIGDPGMGKKTLAAEVYNNIYVKNYFDCRAWVVQPSGPLGPYAEVLLLDEVLKSVMPFSGLSEIMRKNNESKKTTLIDYLRNKTYFIAVVDVWNADKCMKVLRDILPDYNNGSKILMTACPPCNITLSYSFKLEPLNEKQSWEMLTDRDFGKEVSDLLDMETFKEIFEEVCEGLPAFIVTFRSLLAEKDKQDAILKMINYFQADSKFGEGFFKDILDYIYKNLPDHLKPCFNYLLVFSEKGIIDARQLYLLWIAEGFVEDNSEATAEKYLEEIIIRGFIKPTKRSSGGRIKTCRFSGDLHTTVRDLAYSTGLITDYRLDQSDDICTRLLKIEDSHKLLEKMIIDYPHLRSLLFSTSINGGRAQLDGSCIFENLKFLKLLDMGNLVFDQCPAGIEKLLLLRYLKLNIPSLKALPPSLCNLVNLFTLDMPSSYIEEVPDNFWKMQKLRHLNFAFIRLPPYPEDSYRPLEHLNFISVLCPSSCTQCLLGRLPNLRTLRIDGDLSFHQSKLSKSIAKLQCLETLNMVNNGKESSLLPMLLDEYQFPPMLKHLTLSNTKLKEDFMPILGKLSHLEVLKLKCNSYLGRKLACCSSGFPQLKVLHLKSMLWLEEWKMETGAMPKLECLVINPCAYLRRLPEELWCIKTLHKLRLWRPRPEIRPKLREFEDIERYDIQIYPAGL